jgi:hypothetical protein
MLAARPQFSDDEGSGSSSYCLDLYVVFRPSLSGSKVVTDPPSPGDIVYIPILIFQRFAHGAHPCGLHPTIVLRIAKSRSKAARPIDDRSHIEGLRVNTAGQQEDVGIVRARARKGPLRVLS